MIAIRTKNLNRRSTGEATLTRKNNYPAKTNDQPSTSARGKGKEVDNQEAVNEKKKEPVYRNNNQNNYT